MSKLTNEQKEMLHKAIDLAHSPGRCKYVGDDNKPQCIIGQLAFMCGVSVDEMKNWKVEYSNITGTYDAVYHGMRMGSLPVNEKLLSFPESLLSSIQSTWDWRSGDEDLIKKVIHDEVNSY